MLDISINCHMHDGDVLVFTGIDHGDCKSVRIAAGGYPHIALFLQRAHAVQIRDHFAALVESWEPERTLEQAAGSPRRTGEADAV
jgi:hypothetical protein